MEESNLLRYMLGGAGCSASTDTAIWHGRSLGK